MELAKVEMVLEGKETSPFNVTEALQDIQAEFCDSRRTQVAPPYIYPHFIVTTL